MTDRRLLFLLALFLSPFFSLACSDASGSDENENQEWEFGDDCPESGEELTILETRICAYDTRANPIIETGFQCPAALSHRFEMGESVVVCSSDESLPPETIDRLEELFPDVDIAPPFEPGASPLHDPRADYFLPTPTVPTRGAGSCVLSAGINDTRERYEYDETGRPVAFYRGPEGDERLEAEWSFDASGWLATESTYDEAGALIREVTYERGPLGHVEKKTTRLLELGEWTERVSSWAYDDVWRRISRTTAEAGEETVAEFEWSEDGLQVSASGPYFIMPCGGTMTYTPDGKIERYDMPDCAPFGNPTIEREYENDERVRTWQISGDDRRLTMEIILDDQGRIEAARRGTDLEADPPTDNPGRVDVVWSGDRMTKFIQSRDDTGEVLWETTLTGECRLSAQGVAIGHVIFGSALPSQ